MENIRLNIQLHENSLEIAESNRPSRNSPAGICLSLQPSFSSDPQVNGTFICTNGLVFPVHYVQITTYLSVMCGQVCRRDDTRGETTRSLWRGSFTRKRGSKCPGRFCSGMKRRAGHATSLRRFDFRRETINLPDGECLVDRPPVDTFLTPWYRPPLTRRRSPLTRDPVT